MAPQLDIPPSSSTVSVKAYNTVDHPSTGKAPAPSFYKPVLPGHENMAPPSFAFLIQSKATKQRVLFDLGPRKDPENAVPFIAEAARTQFMFLPVSRDVCEQLTDDGVALDTISAAIWSHSHFDHIGDMSKFPSSTDLVIGGDTSKATHVANAHSHLQDSDFADRKVVAIDFASSQLEIGGAKAHDYFGDGSFYLLDTPGHIAGHICGLARVTPTTFVFFGGDACHHPGILRPTEQLHKVFPCPGALLASTRASISAEHFSPVNAAGEFDLAARKEPMLDIVDDGFFEDPPTARDSIKKIFNFDASPDVLVVIAHDSSIVDAVGPFPVVFDEWKAKGWKELLTWAFVDEKNPAFIFKPMSN
ncbi:beta-lactamase-like protein [Roridomyces roridus]|uniref:Beta-lactamase-like protein n=1 Tax=Roridomyces roridus TaxID=1738132 RepID=A0AAD7FTZ2_9AGAR|nr:beta-lactamase-like protein [Roridomyces roridus]